MSYRVACLSGNRLGIDHTNGVDVEREGTAGLFHVDLAKFMKWYWCVKEMRVTATIDWHTDISFPATNTYDFLIERPVDDEYNLSNDVRSLSGSCDDSGVTSTIPGPAGSGTCNLFLQQDEYNSVNQTFGIGIFFFLNVSHVAAVSVGPGPLVGDVTVDGETASGVYQFFSPGGTIDSASILLTPTKFYAFRTKSGLPVYDTLSGIQINDPFA
jgi:hypothetical protein